MGMITTSNEPLPALLEKLRSGEKLVGRDIVKDVTTEKPLRLAPGRSAGSGPEEKIPGGGLRFRGEVSILRSFYKSGCELEVFPARTPPEKILAWKPDGIFFPTARATPSRWTTRSNPCALCSAKSRSSASAWATRSWPRLGGRTTKLKFGHHGANHPVKHLPTGAIEITSQNHGFIVDIESLPTDVVEITHINLNDQTLEGFRHKKLSAFSVQYHPESAPGPHDSQYLFDHFIKEMETFHA